MKYAAALFPILKEFQDNPLETLKELKAMGYDGIEFYGQPSLPAKELKEMLESVGLENAGWQVSWRLLQPEVIDDNLNYQKELGTQNIIIPALGGPWESGHKVNENTIAKWREHLRYIDELIIKLKAYNMLLMYHTHDYDFGEKIENLMTSYELLKKEANSSLFIEIDTGACIGGHLKPEDVILEMKDKVSSLHCRPYSLSLGNEVLFGDKNDENHWETILQIASDIHMKWIVLEPEGITLGKPLECMEQGYKYLKK